MRGSVHPQYVHAVLLMICCYACIVPVEKVHADVTFQRKTTLHSGARLQNPKYRQRHHNDEESLLEDDIVIDDHTPRHRRSRRSAVSDHSKLWPAGIIYYEIDTSFGAMSRRMLEKVMEDFQNRTCIRFDQHTDQVDYVVFSSWQRGCSSSVGRTGGRQTINLSRGCRTPGRFEHEIMHALGFIHEQSRPDRDKYIRLDYPNIKPGYLRNFKKYEDEEIDNLDEEFDFSSIMLYRNQAFSRNGRDTIIPLHDPLLRFGQRVEFSVEDIRKINKLYKCTRQLLRPNYEGLVRENHGRWEVEVKSS